DAQAHGGRPQGEGLPGSRPRAPGGLKDPASGRLRRRAPAQRLGKDPEEGAARAVLAGARDARLTQAPSARITSGGACTSSINTPSPEAGGSGLPFGLVEPPS